jgi:two-component system, OmpR family, sensor histidine kinase BaeS
MRRSFALRLVAAFAGVGIAAAGITAILVNLLFASRFTSYLESQQQQSQNELVAALSASYRRSGGWDPADLRSLEALALSEGGTMQLLGPGGQVEWNPSAGPAGQMATVHRKMMGNPPLGPATPLPIVVEGSRVGTAVVREPTIGVLPQDVAFRSSVNRTLLLGGVVAAVVALSLGLVLARRATAPARELTHAARALASGDHTERVDFDAKDELGEMARAFNAMADTIEEEDELRRSFASDVAHELRTPLAILQTQVEGMQDGVVAAGDAALESLHEETLRLSRLVADLETLASADAARFSLRLRHIALRSLLEDAATQFQGPYAKEGVTLTTTLCDATVNGDPTRIQQVVSNLLSNALKFTPTGGEVRLSCDVRSNDAVIRVSDTGVGIPPSEIDHVFDRFFRGSSVRASGSGIGLAVAKELVVAHGGTIEAQSTVGVGTTFSIRLPLASSPRTVFTPPSHAESILAGRGGDER